MRNVIRYSEAFKRQVVDEVVRGKHSSPYKAQQAYAFRGATRYRPRSLALFLGKTFLVDMNESSFFHLFRGAAFSCATQNFQLIIFKESAQHDCS